MIRDERTQSDFRPPTSVFRPQASSLKPRTMFGNSPPTTHHSLLRSKQERLPAGVHCIPGAGVDPSVAMRGGRTPRETQACFGGKPVSLVHVAAAAARDHVFPRVLTAPRSRHHMIEALRRAAAVLTSVTIPSEHRAPAHGDSPLIRDLDIRSKLHHGRHLASCDADACNGNVDRRQRRRRGCEARDAVPGRGTDLRARLGGGGR